MAARVNAAIDAPPRCEAAPGVFCNLSCGGALALRAAKLDESARGEREAMRRPRVRVRAALRPQMRAIEAPPVLLKVCVERAGFERVGIGRGGGAGARLSSFCSQDLFFGILSIRRQKFPRATRRATTSTRRTRQHALDRPCLSLASIFLARRPRTPARSAVGIRASGSRSSRGLHCGTRSNSCGPGRSGLKHTRRR